ncbi:MAG TPA: putative Ig domain-containing protein, partial [candidate division Zixibacteria bacterium]|nr:putative Ig domain-containing protein [candidate division Zixibacteria bacterium]
MPGAASYIDNNDGTASFSWTPGFTESGSYPITFFATDDSGSVDGEAITITVNEAGNQAPVLAGIGAQITAESVNLNFSVSATDAESVPTLSTSTLPSGASFTPSAGGGTFDWTPGPLQSGAYDVTFYATDDSAAVDSEVVTITVTEGGNLPPVLAAIGPRGTTENVNLNFSVSATDVESIPTVSAPNLPSGASFTPSAGGGTFDWTPTFLQAGSYDVTFYATDDSAAVDSEVVTITVTEAGNQAPVLAAIGPRGTDENVNLNFSVSATDIESTPTVTAPNLPSGASFTPSAGGGTFDWTPTFLQAGSYEVTFYATDDSSAVDSEVVTITVTEAGNQTPVLAAIGPRGTTENVNLNFSVLATDIESTPTVTAPNLPSGATFTPSAGGGTFDWTPNYLQSGSYDVTFYATDDSAAVDSEVVTITVTEAGNQAPVLAAIGPRATNESVNLNFSVSATDVESTPTVTTSALPSGAIFTPSAGGGTFDWTPDFLQSGNYDVTFYATDDSAAVDSEVVTITVSEGGNQSPVLAAIGPRGTTENVNLNFSVSATDLESTPTVSAPNL